MQTILVNTPGPQGPRGNPGPPGPTGSFSDSTGSFVTTSSFNTFTGSYNTGSFTGSFIGDGSGLVGVGGGVKQYCYYELGDETFVSGEYANNITASISSSTYPITFNSSTGEFTGFTSGKLYELEHVFLIGSNLVQQDLRFRFEKDGVNIGNTSFAQKGTSTGAITRSQPTAKAVFLSTGNNVVKIECIGSTGTPPHSYLGAFSFLTIKEV